MFMLSEIFGIKMDVGKYLVLVPVVFRIYDFISRQRPAQYWGLWVGEEVDIKVKNRVEFFNFLQVGWGNLH